MRRFIDKNRLKISKIRSAQNICRFLWAEMNHWRIGAPVSLIKRPQMKRADP
jgi:hypothetical protein